MGCITQVQQQLEAQHAAQVEDLGSKAAQMESLIRQATDLDQQHVTELNAREADLDELRQVISINQSIKFSCPWNPSGVSTGNILVKFKAQCL